MTNKAIRMITITFFVSMIMAIVTYFISGGYKPNNKSVIRLNEVKLDKEISFDLNSIKDIHVNITSENLYVVQSDIEEIMVKAYGTISTSKMLNNYELIVKETDEVLYITIEHDDIEEESKYYDNNMDIFICLPITYSDNLSINARSSNIDIDALDLNKLSVKTVSGDIVLDDITVNDMSFEAISGNVEIKNIDAENVDINTDSSYVLVEKIISKQTTAYTASGVMEIHNISGDFLGTCESGNIKISAPKLNGDIKLESRSGDVEVFLNNYEDLRVDINTYSGKIVMGLDEINALEKTSFHASYINKNDTNKVNISTTSGNILIKEIKK